MNKQDVIIPKGIKYLGKWKDFRFSNFPAKCILDKVIPGCGFTEYCLNGPENVILCSPRKILLENKKERHGDSVYLVQNEYEVEVNYDKNLERPDKAKYVIKNPTAGEAKDVYKRLYEEIQAYGSMRFTMGNKPCKILVTYDSFHIIKDILEHLGMFKDFYIVVDEFQTILHDAKFKSSTELRFLGYLERSHSSIFVSATPMMEECLEQLDEFNKLPYYVFDWVSEDPMRIINPSIKTLTMKSVGTKCEEIIEAYKSGKFEKTNILVDGKIKEVESREAVFYVNSVNHIINVINKCGLSPDEVNILCSNTDYNKRRLKSKLKGHIIGRVPLQGEPNKMFTFCTRTVYLGADFYSDNARTFVFSDANINTLVVDISEDLAQILGRQRDENNPWSNSAVFYYIQSKASKLPEEVYLANLEKKLSTTESLLRSYKGTAEIDKENLAKKYERIAEIDNYRDDYVALDFNGIPVMNRLNYLAEKRAYEIQKYDYADRVTIFNKIRDKFGSESLVKNTELEDLRDKYNTLTRNEQRLELLCSVSPDLMYQFVNTYLVDSDPIKSTMIILDQKRVIGLGYNITRINKEIQNQRVLRGLGPEILLEFHVGDHYSNTYIAGRLQLLYDKYGVSVRAKATDIKKWFEVKALKLQDKKENKRINGLKLVGLKKEREGD